MADEYSFPLEDWTILSTSGTPFVRFAHGLLELGLTKEKVLGFTAFHNWINTLQASLKRQKLSNHTFTKEPYFLRWIRIQAFDEFPIKGTRRILFMKIFAEVTNDKEKADFLPGVVFFERRQCGNTHDCAA